MTSSTCTVPWPRPRVRLWSGPQLTGALVGAALVIATAVVALGPWPQHTTVVADALSVVGSVFAAACCAWATTRAAGTGRVSWALFTVTMLLWSIADAFWFAGDLTDELALLGSVADWLYLVGLVPLSAALVVFPAGRWEHGARLRLLLDATVLGSALLVISQLLVLREVVARSGDTWTTATYVVFPVTDTLMAGLAVLLLLRSVGKVRRDLVLICLAFIIWTVADDGYALLSVRGQDYTRTLFAVAYVLAPVLLALGALSAESAAQEPTLRRHLTGKLTALTPDAAAVTAGVLCFVAGLTVSTDWALVACAFACVAFRQVLVTSDNHGLRVGLELRVAERTAALEELSTRHQRLLDSVGEGIVGIDPLGRLSFVNPAAARMLQWRPEDLIGRDACATLCAEQHDECPLRLVHSLREVMNQSQTRCRRRDGTTLPIEVTAAPATDPTQDQGVVVIFRDISERHALDQMKREFISAVSHELRTPLTAIRGSLEVLGDGDAGELSPVAQGIVTMAERGAERLTRLVNDILEVERLEAGSFSVGPRAVEIAPLVESTLASLEALAAKAQVSLVRGPLDGSALADPDRVVQALVNLVGNAVKFTPAGGAVRVASAAGPHELTITVTDQGRGIPPEELDRIFEKFHQVSALDAREQGGTGLGLTITKAIVERHGGRIWVDSDPGVGSTFGFTLPTPTETSPDRVLEPAEAEASAESWVGTATA